MGWFLTGRGKAVAAAAEADFMQALRGVQTTRTSEIEGLRARLRAITTEVHERASAVPSIPEGPSMVSGAQAQAVRAAVGAPDVRRPSPSRPIALVRAVGPNGAGGRPVRPAIPREEPVDDDAVDTDPYPARIPSRPGF